MDGTVLAGIISAGVAVVGTGITFLSRNRDSSDRRLDLVFTANQALLDDLRAERTDLLARIVALETLTTAQAKELSRLLEKITEQAIELRVLHQRETELRHWATEIMAWAAVAVQLIRSMGGHIEEPTHPPRP